MNTDGLNTKLQAALYGKVLSKGYAPDALALPVDEFARRFCVSQSFIWKLIRQNEIAAIRLGRRTLVPASEIARLMEVA